MALDPKDFASSFKGFMEIMSSQSVSEEPPFLRLLTEHFGEKPNAFPVISQDFPRYDHANLHVALEELIERPGCSAEIVGFMNDMGGFHSPTLAELVAPAASGMYGRSPASVGPVQYVNISLDGDRTLACVKLGLYLFKCDSERIAVLIRPGDYSSMRENFFLDVMSREKVQAEKFLSDVRAVIRKKNVYRNQVLSIQKGEGFGGTIEIKFHALKRIKHDDIILPEGLLNRIERNTIRFGQLSSELLAAKRHLKRGLLLYGPPGTGKTMTAMYLASEMSRTILLVTGRNLELIQQSCSLARALQPAMVVLEDVDLIAEERTRQQGCANPILFELLNEMDGLADDVDTIFLLTTNRADLLEPALAARPGRIDQAFEVPLPDEQCRKRLFDLYSQGLTMKVSDSEQFIKRTEGASAAFICEMLRKAALFAAEGGSPITITDRHLDEALRELIFSGGVITRSLLGFREPPPAD